MGIEMKMSEERGHGRYLLIVDRLPLASSIVLNRANLERSARTPYNEMRRKREKVKVDRRETYLELDGGHLHLPPWIAVSRIGDWSMNLMAGGFHRYLTELMPVPLLHVSSKFVRQ